MLGMIIGVLVTGGVGVAIAVLGWLIWKRERLDLMHDYHVDKVSAENRRAFCELSGKGLVVIGAGLLVTAVLLGITESVWSFGCFAGCFAAGLAMLVAAVGKYNR